MSNVTDFEKYWKKFIVKMKGALIESTKNQPLTYSVASITLSDVAMAWSLDYDDCGRWLAQYKQKEPRKGELVSSILTKDMQFSPIEEKKSFPEAAKLAVPAAGAALGFGISNLLGAGAVIQIVSALVPAVLLYPAMNMVGQSINQKNQVGLMDAYLAQLDKYRLSVLTVIGE